ncbi:MAG: prephenate dehydrogenase/arogenate dehydrogenase family protein [Clostridiales bacterium]|jgi:prephenate dehydrogenase|nr:prephenate dehydrogenase/arogenate dehydrogenase family protein [Clostridiales bacterium]
MKKFNYAPRDITKAINIGIVGMGQIGASLARALRYGNPDINIIGVDKDESVLEYAFTEGIIQLGNANMKILRGTTVVFVAAPQAETAALINEVYSVVKHDAVITDTAGLKEPILSALPVGIRYVGGHPFAGSVAAGILQSKRHLFEGAYYVLTSDRAKGGDTAEVAELVRHAGAIPVEMTAAAHDAVIGGITQTPALAAFAVYAGVDGASGGVERFMAADFLKKAALGSIDAASFAKGLTDNGKYTVAALDDLILRLGQARKLIIDSDADGLRVFIAEAAAHVGTDAGAAKPKFGTDSLTVDAPSAPGALNRITGILAKRKINIKTVSIAPVREGAIGALKLEFDSEDDCELARALLKKKKVRVC